MKQSKGTRAASKLLLGLTALTYFSCKEKADISNEASKKESAGVSTTISFAYDLVGSGCPTGLHIFKSFAELCEGLRDDTLNRGCAINKRREEFKLRGCVGSFETPATTTRTQAQVTSVGTLKQAPTPASTSVVTPGQLGNGAPQEPSRSQSPNAAEVGRESTAKKVDRWNVPISIYAPVTDRGQSRCKVQYVTTLAEQRAINVPKDQMSLSFELSSLQAFPNSVGYRSGGESSLKQLRVQYSSQVAIAHEWTWIGEEKNLKMIQNHLENGEEFGVSFYLECLSERRMGLSAETHPIYWIQSSDHFRFPILKVSLDAKIEIHRGQGNGSCSQRPVVIDVEKFTQQFLRSGAERQPWKFSLYAQFGNVKFNQTQSVSLQFFDDVNFLDSEAESSLHFEFKLGDMRTIQSLLKQGGKMRITDSAVCFKELEENRDSESQTLFVDSLKFFN